MGAVAIWVLRIDGSITRAESSIDQHRAWFNNELRTSQGTIPISTLARVCNPFMRNPRSRPRSRQILGDILLRPHPTVRLALGMAFGASEHPERRICILVVGRQRENQ
jgi:hypothetical protein